MRTILFLLFASIAGAGYWLHTQDLLDDVPHMLKTLAKPSHEQPVHHFYYGLKSGEFIFTGMALDKAGIENLSELQDLSESQKSTLQTMLQHATCQLEFEILNSELLDDKAFVNIRINTVHPTKLAKALAGGTLTGLLSKDPTQKILNALRETGCTGKTKEIDQQVELHQEEGSWKICSECAGKDLMLDVLFQIVTIGI